MAGGGVARIGGSLPRHDCETLGQPPNAHRINHLRIQPFWCFELPQANSLIGVGKPLERRRFGLNWERVGLRAETVHASACRND